MGVDGGKGVCMSDLFQNEFPRVHVRIKIIIKIFVSAEQIKQLKLVLILS